MTMETSTVEESVSEKEHEEYSLDVSGDYHEEAADKTTDMDKLCDKILQDASIVLNGEEKDILSDSFIDSLIMHKEKLLHRLKDNDSDNYEDL